MHTKTNHENSVVGRGARVSDFLQHVEHQKRFFVTIIEFHWKSVKVENVIPTVILQYVFFDSEQGFFQ